MKLLLVEDDENTQEMITALLKRLDFTIDIEAANDGDHGLKCYLDRSHDLVITDNAHPGILGIELIDLILARNPLQRVILQTGNSSEQIETFRQKHKDIPFLQKPYSLRVLLDTVKAMV